MVKITCVEICEYNGYWNMFIYWLYIEIDFIVHKLKWGIINI